MGQQPKSATGTTTTATSSSTTSSSSPQLAVAVVGMGIGMVVGSLFTRYYYLRHHHVATATATAGITKKASSLLANRPVYKPVAGRQLQTQTQTQPQPTKIPPKVLDNQKDDVVVVFDPSKLKSSYNLMISTVTPRPIALVSSHNAETGIDNVAPFSYFGAVAHDPPMLAIGFCRNGPNRDKKDSLVNILSSSTPTSTPTSTSTSSKQQQFAVNIMSEWYLDAANHTCGMFKPEVDEFEVSGLTKVKDCTGIDSNIPRVGEAAVTYECQVEYIHPVVSTTSQEPTTEIVLARVLRVHVNSSVLVDDYDPTKPMVDTVNKLRPVGRLGGNIYSTIGEVVDIPRPRV